MSLSLCVVYQALNLINGKRYIGATDRGMIHRARRHKWDAAHAAKRSIFHNAIRKHGFDAFSFSVLRECSDYFDALHWERILISELKPEYNLTGGGGGVKGLKFSAASKEKMAAAKRGKPNHWSNGRMPQELRDKLSAKQRARKGFPISDKQRKALIVAMKKGNAARRRRVICTSDGCCYESVTAAANAYNLTTGQVSYHCSGNHESRRGLIFRYGDKIDEQRNL